MVRDLDAGSPTSWLRVGVVGIVVAIPFSLALETKMKIITMLTFDDDNEVIDLRGFVNTTSSIETMAVTDMSGAFPDPIGLKDRRCEEMSPFLADSQRHNARSI